MNCQEGMELMQRHVDGDLNEQETARLMEHVGHCPDCAAMLERLVRLSRGLEQLPRVTPPYSLVDAILPELGKWDAASAETADAAGTAFAAPRSRRAAHSRRAWVTRAAGVAALGVIVGLFLVNGPMGKLADHKQNTASVAESSASKLSAAGQSANGPQSDQAPAASPAPTLYAKGQDNMKTFGAEAGSSQPAPKSEPAPRASAHTDGAASGGNNKMGILGGGSGAGADTDNRSHGDDPVVSLPGGDVNQGFAVTPDADSTEPPASIMSEEAAKEEAVSPDGQWKAVLEYGKLQVFRQSDGNLVYDQTPDQGKRSGLSWNDNSTALQYSLTDVEGHSTPMVLQVPEMKEKAR